MKRDKSNLVPPAIQQREPIILGAEERAAYLSMIHLWRSYDLWFLGLLEIGA